MSNVKRLEDYKKLDSELSEFNFDNPSVRARYGFTQPLSEDARRLNQIFRDLMAEQARKEFEFGLLLEAMGKRHSGDSLVRLGRCRD